MFEEFDVAPSCELSRECHCFVTLSLGYRSKNSDSFSVDRSVQEVAIMDRKAYEHLAELNRNVESALAILQKLTGCSN